MTRSVARAARRAVSSFATLAAAALLLASAGSAQQSTTKLGIYAGGTSSAYHGNDTPGPMHIGGFVAGLWTEWSLAPHWSIAPELQFVQKGSTQLDFVGSSIVPEHIRMSYVEIPVLLRATASAMNGFSPWIAAGPHIAFKAACSLDATVESTHYDNCSQLITTGNAPPQPATTESVDYGVTGAVGVDYRVGGQVLTLSARYDQGLVNVFSAQDVKNRAFLFLLGVKIR